MRVSEAGSSHFIDDPHPDSRRWLAKAQNDAANPASVACDTYWPAADPPSGPVVKDRQLLAFQCIAAVDRGSPTPGQSLLRVRQAAEAPPVTILNRASSETGQAMLPIPTRHAAGTQMVNLRILPARTAVGHRAV